MKEYKTDFVTTSHNLPEALNDTINFAVQAGWKLVSMQPMVRYCYSNNTPYDGVLVLFEREKKEQS